MVFVGRVLTIVGFFGTIGLLAIAFWFLFRDQDAEAMLYFVKVPFVSLMMFVGFMTVVLLEPRK